MDFIDIIISLMSIVISVGGGYLIKFLNEKIGNEKVKYYHDLATTIVMSIEQLNPDLAGIDKKQLATEKILQLTGNKISDSDADMIIESAVYEIKKLLNTHVIK